MKNFVKIIGSGAGVVAALVISVSTTQAQNLLVNGSFEDPNGFTSNPITNPAVQTGWALFDGRSSRTDMSSSPDSPEDGYYALLEVNAAGNGWNPAGAYQIVPASAGTLYTASIWALTDTGVQGDWWTTPGFFELVFLNSSLTTNGLSVTPPSVSTGWFGFAAKDTWYQFTIGEVAPVGTAYVAVYAMNMVSGANQATVDVYYDNAVLVPEPASLALMTLGLAVPFYFLRRKSA